MSTQQNPGPVAVTPSNPAGLCSAEQLQSAFDNGIWYLLSLWPALHTAVSNAWGGPDSEDKRDWFAGAVSDLFTSRPDTDAEELEAFLLQIMQDEFECNVEDGSEVAVAKEILDVYQSLKGGNGEVGEERLERSREAERRWRNRGQLKMHVKGVTRNGQAEGEWEEEEADEEDLDEEDEEGDVDMDAAEEMAPALVPALPKKEKAGPEVDDDGFTKVSGKRRAR
jgi:pre-rRNA-processing protein TSR2